VVINFLDGQIKTWLFAYFARSKLRLLLLFFFLLSSLIFRGILHEHSLRNIRATLLSLDELIIINSNINSPIGCPISIMYLLGWIPTEWDFYRIFRRF
jgi:hypothetical protein